MKKLIYLSIFGLLIISCNSAIKNNNDTIEIEDGTQVESAKSSDVLKVINPILGYWVGYFENDNDESENQMMYVDEGFVWNKENKINISIDQITDSLVIGHSVVAGNDRPFKGTVIKKSDGSFTFEVKEPGDDKYDGKFVFTIKDNELIGKWVAYKHINISKRKYTLQKMNYVYDPNVLLEESKQYVDWHTVIEKKEEVEMDENEFEEWITREFASATDQIYKINASNKLLSKSVVENLKKGDLKIIRNTIYARHGYSFKNAPLRVFFDAQSWYIPVNTDIKDSLTEIEKQNIQLLLKYEKNATEYYDYFGRG